jgi:hypothetical protein
MYIYYAGNQQRCLTTYSYDLYRTSLASQVILKCTKASKSVVNIISYFFDLTSGSCSKLSYRLEYNNPTQTFFIISGLHPSQCCYTIILSCFIKTIIVQKTLNDNSIISITWVLARAKNIAYKRDI